MPPIDALDTLAQTPGDAKAGARIRALGAFFTAIHSSNDAHLFSIFAGGGTPLSSPELHDMPNVRRWEPMEDEQGYPYLFFDSELSLAQRAGGAIERAASYTDIPTSVLARPQAGHSTATDPSLMETLIGVLTNEWNSSRLCEPFWKDQRLSEAQRAIYALSFEGDNYLVFVGPGDLAEPCIVFVGEQPFEFMLYGRDMPKGGTPEVFPESTDINGHTLEAKSMLPKEWWDDLVDSGLQTLLRATFMQMGMPGQPLDITTPDATPKWRNIPMLGDSAQSD